MVRFKGNRIVYVVVYGTTQDAQGFTSPVELDRWKKFADVWDRRGSNSNPYQQSIWQYDIVVKMRFDPAYPTQSNYEIEYGNRRCKIEGVRIDNEAHQAYEICYCSYIDNAITTPDES